MCTQVRMAATITKVTNNYVLICLEAEVLKGLGLLLKFYKSFVG